MSDRGVCALASAGCGKELTLLRLVCESNLEWPLMCGVLGSGGVCAHVTLFSLSPLFTANAQLWDRECRIQGCVRLPLPAAVKS